MGPYPAVRYNSSDGTMSVAIVTHLGQAFCFDDLEGPIKGVWRNPSEGCDAVDALRMKKATVRMKDHYDAAWLKQEFDLKN
jgi:hypothetical protein